MREAGTLGVEAGRPEVPVNVIDAAALRAAIVEEARSWLRTPFVPQGGVRGVGVDCVQFILHVYRAAGVLPPDFTDGLPYPSGWAREGVDGRYRRELCEPYFACVLDDGPHRHTVAAVAQPGDLLLYKECAAEGHGAIVTAWPLVVHAYPRENVLEAAADRNALAGLTCTSVWRPKALVGS